MNEAGNEKRPVTIEQYTTIIEQAYPELKGANVRPVNEEGQYNDALLVDDPVFCCTLT